MKKYFILIFISLLSFAPISAQQIQERELRSTWVATVSRIDWPAVKLGATGHTTQTKSQKDDITFLLDSLLSVNINTVFFQIRSHCDAMYKSSYEPWSEDLVATRGMEPGYDPLQFIIDEGHKRGLEIHAWINPYRFETWPDQWLGKPGVYRETHPDWLLHYPKNATSGKKPVILNPGIPAVRKHVTNIVAEVVNNYDIDGVVFDDYFYPYEGTPDNLDSETQKLYKPNSMSIGDWRRSNVDELVKSVYDTIQKVKPYVTFGISPFGIWTINSSVAQKEGITLPSNITGMDAYSQIYCNPVSWMKAGTVDYISPQLYWPTTSTGQSYNRLCPWWSDLAARYNTHFYASHSLTAIDKSKSALSTGDILMVSGEIIPRSFIYTEQSSDRKEKQMSLKATDLAPNEYGLQIAKNRSSIKYGAPGSVFFSTKHFYYRKHYSTDYYNKSWMQYLRNNEFKYKALRPAIDWKKHKEYSGVEGLELNGSKLTWTAPDPGLRYTVYIVPKTSTDFETNKVKYLQGVTYVNEYTIPNDKLTDDYNYAVAVFDRYGNEFDITFRKLQSSIGNESAPNINATICKDGDKNILRLSFNSEENTSISLHSVSGTKIADITSGMIVGTKDYLLPDNLANGVYIITIKTKSMTKSLKFIN
ncbi:family 10 glycosylhydrolase [Dysgonomonas sp. 520]|uniref:family 10 glycosylhydrolase n=1 Tax=Dysgonomonas sp. 520 TaxID=2302931 RepID=UPI0013D527B8|nr:family 10 glycosylhydrolase [Dysgonomonas sp. 520]NDW09488.1 T9SS C-terminal target domain-containing protein [Dysgonomonas sp. 520]